MNDPTTWPLGATLGADGVCRFLVWAPHARSVELVLPRSPRWESRDPLLPQGALMQPLPCGYYAAEVGGLAAGERYAYSLDGGEPLPDPASRWQPDGPHAPSALAPADIAWSATAWRNPPLERYVIYELHVGTFTAEGTFDAAAGRLPELADLGVAAIEVMPIAQFPGGRNWGYDGVGVFAAQSTYGGRAGFKRLVDAAHRAGLAVVLDVVYNHIGPEGNYLPRFGPYFTDRYKTPWGQALNFDGPGSDEVRRFFIESALYWTGECRVDALRLDAVHAIVDPTPLPFIEELCAAVHAQAQRLGRRVYCIAESAANDARLTTPREQGGLGLDAQWNDDFHHALRTLLTREDKGYYRGYGTLAHLQKAYTRGFVYTGEHSPAQGRHHGTPGASIPAERLVAFSQNHDHAGNRAHGERLNALVTPAQARLAAAATILSPFVPLLFMGEEYGETAPFQYFISHTDPALVEAVRKGRLAEFSAFAGQTSSPPPDPQAEITFARSRLNHDLKSRPEHARTLAMYRELLRLRRETPALARPVSTGIETTRDDAAHTLFVRRPGGPAGEGDVIIALCFGNQGSAAKVPPGAWRHLFCTEDPRWGGAGAAAPAATGPAGVATLPPWSCTVYARGVA